MKTLSWRRSALVAVFIVALLGVLATLVLAAPAGTQKLRVEFERMVSEAKEGKVRISTLSKAKVLQDDATFVADTIVMRTEDNVHEFTCTGNPIFTDSESRITGDKVIGYSTPRRGEFVGNVKMVTTPKKKDPKGDLDKTITGDPSTTTCDSLSYNYGQKRGLAKGNVVVVQKARTVWADEAVYERETQLITMRGHVKMKNAGEGEMRDMENADTVTVALNDDWIDIQAKPNERVILNLDVKDEEKPAKK